MDESTLAAVIAAAVKAALGEAPASAPAAPRAASPFASAVRLTDAAGNAEAAIPEPLRGLERKDRKAAAAVLALPAWSCTVDAQYSVPGEAEPRTGALHGFTFARTPGESCPGVSGLAKGEACPGTVRA